MAMFGASRLRNPYNAPGYGMDGGFPPETMPEDPISQPANPFAQAMTPPAPQGMMASPKKPGFGEPGGWGERLGAIGSILLNTAGVQDDGYDLFLQTKRMRAEEQRKQQLAEAARYAPQHIGNNIVRLSPQTEQYETLYKGSQETPYRWRSNDGSLMELGPDGQPRVAYADPTEKPNYEWVTDPTTGAKSLYQIPPSSRTAPQGPPPGVTFTPLPSGGAAPKGPATFR